MLQAQHSEVMQLLQGWMREQDVQQKAAATLVSKHSDLTLVKSEASGAVQSSGSLPGFEKLVSETWVSRRQTPTTPTSPPHGGAEGRRQRMGNAPTVDEAGNDVYYSSERHDERQISGKEHEGTLDNHSPLDRPPDLTPPEGRKSTSTWLQVPGSQKKLSSAQALVQHRLFEAVFGVAVIANGVLIGWLVDADDAEESALDTCQHVFNGLFLLELLIRLSADGPRAYFCASRSQMWNFLDLLLVLSGTFETCMAMVAGTESTPDLNHMRLLRLVRLMRLARIVRFVRALQILLHSIVSTLKSMAWVAFLVCLVVYFFGIVFAQAVGDTDDISRAREHWGTLPRAMFTLFQVMTNGVDWGTVVQPLADVHWALVCVFIFFVTFVFFALMNVITGIFCQAAMEGVQQERDFVVTELLSNKKMYVEKTHNLFTEMFAQIDADGSGNVTLEEFEAHIMDEVVQAYFAILELDTSDAYTLFKLLDADGSNGIDAEEFVDGCLKLKGAARSIDLIRLSTEMRWMAKQLTRFISTTNAQFAALRRSL